MQISNSQDFHAFFYAHDSCLKRLMRLRSIKSHEKPRAIRDILQFYREAIVIWVENFVQVCYNCYKYKFKSC